MLAVFYVLFFLAACLALAQGGRWMIDSLLKLSVFWNWKKIKIAFLIIALAASLPALIVGLTSALSDKPELSFGSIIGANIIILTLMVWLADFLNVRIQFKAKALQRPLLFAAFYALLPLVLVMDGHASRGDGVILIIALAFYIRELLARQKKTAKFFPENEKEKKQESSFFSKTIAIFLLGFGLAIASALIIVFSASRLALGVNLPIILIGVLGLAIGTVLPRLFFDIRSAKEEQNEMIPINFLNAISISSPLILGLVCLISPFKIYNMSLYINAFIFSGLAILFFLVFSKTGGEINRREGRFLFFLYILFFIIESILR